MSHASFTISDETGFTLTLKGADGVGAGFVLGAIIHTISALIHISTSRRGPLPSQSIPASTLTDEVPLRVGACIVVVEILAASRRLCALVYIDAGGAVVRNFEARAALTGISTVGVGTNALTADIGGFGTLINIDASLRIVGPGQSEPRGTLAGVCAVLVGACIEGANITCANGLVCALINVSAIDAITHIACIAATGEGVALTSSARGIVGAVVCTCRARVIDHTSVAVKRKPGLTGA